MKALFKKTLICLLIVASCFTAACGGSAQTPVITESTVVHVWTASGAEKIMRDTDYSDRYNSTSLDIAVFRNEYEAGQIIISPEFDVDEYTLELSDLSLKTDSSVKLSKSCFEVYNQKYVKVDVIELVTTGGGYYPDALLPYEKAVEYSENNVLAGRNQGLWITVKPDKEQQPGVYTGSFKLTVGGQEKIIPANVTVYGHVLSDESHLKSSFGTNWNWVARAELDVTIDMQREYYEFMLDHRCSTGELPGSFYNVVTRPYLSIPATFLEEAHKAALDPRCTNYALSNNSCIVYEEDGTSRLAFDLDYFRTLLTAMAEYSVENKVDLFKKATYSIVFLDEYSAWGKEEATAFNLDRVWDFTSTLADEFEQSLACDDAEFKQTLLESLRGIICFIAGDPLVLEAYSDKYPNANLVPVPLITSYNSQSYREKIDEYISKGYNQKWVYTACNLYPSTSYFLEAPVMSPRLNGWMMFDYDISGDLYWETAYYFKVDSDKGTLQIQDQYDVARRQSRYNGEGQLLYPGREYGIYGPVGSIRLDAIRDSHEDYDLFCELEDLYKTRGVTSEQFDTIYHNLSKGLYLGTEYTEAENAIEILNNARRVLAELFDLYEEGGVAVHGYTVNSGKCEVTLTAEEGTAVKVNGTALSGETADGIVTFTHSFALDQDENVLNVRAEKGGKVYEAELALGGKTTAVAATELSDKLTATNASANADASNKCIKITPDSEADKVTVKLNTSSLKIDQSKSSLYVSVYVYGEGQIEANIAAKLKNVRVLKDVSDVVLKPGWNEIEIDVLTQLKCATNGALEYLTIEISGEVGEFGIGEIIITG